MDLTTNEKTKIVFTANSRGIGNDRYAMLGLIIS